MTAGLPESRPALRAASSSAGNAIASAVERGQGMVRDRISLGAIGRALRPLLLALVLFLGAASPAQADNCSDYPNGVLDRIAGTLAPPQLQIDRNCTIRNPPNRMSTNLAFLSQPGQATRRRLRPFATDAP